MIIKSVLAASALALAASSSFAADVSINRAGAASIRACSETAGGPYSAVCYNQVTGLQIGPLDFSRENVVRVSCDRRAPYTVKTTRGQVAREFCPQVDAGVLAPAPFLL